MLALLPVWYPLHLSFCVTNPYTRPNWSYTTTCKIGPALPAWPTWPAWPARPTRPAWPARPTRTTRPTRPARPTWPTWPTRPTWLASLVGPVGLVAHYSSYLACWSSWSGWTTRLVGPVRPASLVGHWAPPALAHLGFIGQLAHPVLLVSLAHWLLGSGASWTSAPAAPFAY